MIILGSIDIERLVAKLNASLSDKESSIELGDFRYRRAIALFERFRDRSVNGRGQYPLIQNIPSSGIGSIFGLDGERNLGYAFMEYGHLISTGVRYELMRLKTKRPLAISTGVLPACDILVYHDEKHDSRLDLVLEDEFWVRKDLTKVLPSEWFATPAL